MLDVLLAQNLDPLSGGSGWIGAGLLGLVLAWLLLKHLPAKDAQFQKFLEDKDKTIQALVVQFGETSKSQRVDFKEALLVVTKHCEEEMKRIVQGK